MTKVVISALYWFAVLFLIGFVDVLHGDCGVSGNIHQCNVEARHIDLTLLAVAAVLYGYLIWRLLAAHPSE